MHKLRQIAVPAGGDNMFKAKLLVTKERYEVHEVHSSGIQCWEKLCCVANMHFYVFVMSL